EGRYDARGDVYALGLTLYELLALRPAFAEKDRNKLIRLAAGGTPARLDRLNRSIPRDLVTVVHKAIERDPAHRYQSAGELAADLQRFRDDVPVKARRTGVAESLARWARRNRGVAALASATVLLLLAMTAVSTLAAWKLRRERDAVLAEQQRANVAERKT